MKTRHHFQPVTVPARTISASTSTTPIAIQTRARMTAASHGETADESPSIAATLTKTNAVRNAIPATAAAAMSRAVRRTSGMCRAAMSCPSQKARTLRSRPS